MDDKSIKESVKKRYGNYVLKPRASGCCGSGGAELGLGYSIKDLKSIPQESILGLGCGNPTGLSDIKEGETVVDLGSGAGIDCFIAANKTGSTGRVIGIDMTPEMIDKARRNAAQNGYANVEFVNSDIESIALEDGIADLVISNCVLNLVPDKLKAFKEIRRILKPGGRFIISDIVLLRDLPQKVKESAEAYAACIAGALLKEQYLDTIREAGFDAPEIIGEHIYTGEEVGMMIGSFDTDLSSELAEIKSLDNAGSSILVKAYK